MNRLPDRASALLDQEIRDCTAISGGSLSEVLRLRLADDSCVIAKGGPDPAAEAEMLSAIRESGAPAPRVIEFDKDCLIIEALRNDGQLANAWADAGNRLSELHRTTGTQYGWHIDYAFSSVHIPNSFTSDWPEFWAECRLLTHVRHLNPAIAKRVELLASRIRDFLPPAPRPSLLHGDLWGGNVLVSGAAISGFIDPACYFGHGEVDLAMLCLFDHPAEEFFAAYGPLEPGHQERLAVYSLWPALVHLRLFGDSYLSMNDRFLSLTGH